MPLMLKQNLELHSLKLKQSKVEQSLNYILSSEGSPLMGYLDDHQPFFRITWWLDLTRWQIRGHSPLPTHADTRTKNQDKINYRPLGPSGGSPHEIFFLYYKAPQIHEEQSTGVRCRPPHLDALGEIPKMPKLPVSLFVPSASILALYHLHRDTGPWKQAVLNNFDKNKSQASGLVPTCTEWTVITGKIWAPTLPGHPPIHEKKTLRELHPHINTILLDAKDLQAAPMVPYY